MQQIKQTMADFTSLVPIWFTKMEGFMWVFLTKSMVDHRRNMSDSLKQRKYK